MALNSPKISVIIVSWNVADSLDSCLRSVFATKYPNLEVVVVDNASSDDSPSVVQKYPNVALIKNATNMGFPKAINLGLSRGTGEFYLLLNPDTRIAPDFFKKILNTVHNYPRAGVIGPKLKNIDGTVQASVFPETSVINTIREYWLGQGPLTQKYVPDGNQPVSVNAISGSCMFIPAPVIKQIGRFTERVFMYYEDLDFCRRIRAAGLQVIFDPKIQIVHEHGKSSVQSAKSNPEILPFWRGYLWQSSLWYNGPLKHYLLAIISFTGQKLHRNLP